MTTTDHKIFQDISLANLDVETAFQLPRSTLAFESVREAGALFHNDADQGLYHSDGTAWQGVLVGGAAIADNAVVRGDGGGFGIQGSGVLIDDADNLSGLNGLASSGTGTVSLVTTSTAVGAITLDASTGAGGIDIDAGTGGIAVDTTGVLALDSIGLSVDANGGVIEVLTTDEMNASTAGFHVVSSQATADAISLDATDAAGGIDIDAGTGGIAIDTTGALSLDGAAASNVTVTGAGIDLTLESDAGRVVIRGGESTASAIELTTPGVNGGVDINCGFGGFLVDTPGPISLDAFGDSNLNSNGGSLTLGAGAAAANAVHINASNAAGGIDIDAGTGGIDVDTTGTFAQGGRIVYTDLGVTTGPGAVPAGTMIEITTTGTGDALTLADGVDGQRLFLIYVAEGAGADTAILTPATFAGGTTITFNALGDAADLLYSSKGGWYFIGGAAVVA